MVLADSIGIISAFTRTAMLPGRISLFPSAICWSAAAKPAFLLSDILPFLAMASTRPLASPCSKMAFLMASLALMGPGGCAEAGWVVPAPEAEGVRLASDSSEGGAVGTSVGGTTDGTEGAA